MIFFFFGRFDGDSSGLKERRKPPALPTHVLDEEGNCHREVYFSLL